MATIPLRNRAGKVVAEAIVDDEDFEWLNQWRWYLNESTGYVARTQRYGPRSEDRRRMVLMHRLILGLDFGDTRQGDHRDLNRLNNQRSNLRVVPGQWANKQNGRAHAGSTSPLRGVSFDPSRDKWRAQATLDGRNHFLGRYDTEEEAGAVAAEFRRQHMPYSRD